MTWLIFAGIALTFCVVAWVVAAWDVPASVDQDQRFKHQHDYVRVGYGGAGWSLYRCACGETEIDA